MKQPAIYINECYFLAESELLVSIAIQVISCNLEACIILIFISVPLSDKKVPSIDKTFTRNVYF